MEYLSICLCHFLIYFISVLQFSVYSSFVSLGKFIPRYLITFVAMMNGIDSLISLSDSSLLVYRNESDFYALTLYPATLINLLINSSNLLILSLGFSIYSTLWSANNENFVSSFSIWISFLSFSSLVTVARTSKTMLNNSGKSGHLCLIPDLRENAFSFSSLRIMFAVGLSYGLYYVEVGFFYAHFMRSFNHKSVLNFLKGFFCIYWDSHMVFIFQFVNMIYHIDLFLYVKESMTLE